MQVFEGMLRLSKLYLKLCKVGQIDYLTWENKFQCSKEERKRENLMKNINEICNKMENDLKQWMETIDSKRKECYTLNHFTLKQILYLRKMLAEVCRGEIAIDELPLQAFMLLEAINPHVDYLLLADVLKMMTATNLIRVKDDSSSVKRDCVNETEDEGNLERNIQLEDDLSPPTKRRRKNSFEAITSAKEKLEEMNYSEKYLIAALKNCGRHASEDDLVEWVLSNDTDEETITSSFEDAKNDHSLSDVLKGLLGQEFCANDKESTMASPDG